eukprot:5163769-Pleurochrysis_carterae.AAC.1
MLRVGLRKHAQERKASGIGRCAVGITEQSRIGRRAQVEKAKNSPRPQTFKLCRIIRDLTHETATDV